MTHIKLLYYISKRVNLKKKSTAQPNQMDEKAFDPKRVYFNATGRY